MIENYTNIADAYQTWTRTTVKYPDYKEGEYVTSGLVGEVGELMSAAAKFHRGDYDVDEYKKRAKSELGDVLWFVARFADYYGWNLSDVMLSNQSKLTDRINRDVVKGDGDNR